MIVFPAIDLIGGKVVRLERGDRAHMKVYSDDPVAVAEDFRDRGARWVHVVDLSAALEEDAAAQAANAAAIRGICAVPGIRIDAGGGVRSLAAFERLLALGARRVAVGTALVRDTALAAQVARSFGAQLACGQHSRAILHSPKPRSLVRRFKNLVSALSPIADSTVERYVVEHVNHDDDGLRSSYDILKEGERSVMHIVHCDDAPATPCLQYFIP